MAIAKGFTDYNRRYLELRDIFEFLFPITPKGKTKVFYNIITEYLNELNSGTFDANKFDFVLSKKIFRDKERVFPEHNIYNANNELWYNLIFTMYHEDDVEKKNDLKQKKERSYAKTERKNEKSEHKNSKAKYDEYFGVLDIFKEINNDENLSALKEEKKSCMFHKKDIANFLGVMDKITPFSTLGFWMYIRVKQVLPSIPVIFHGGNPRIGGLQDILFQISYLIQKKKKAYINNTGPFQFKKIIYEDTSLYQEKNNPYILATCKYKSNNIIVKIYIQGDMDLIIHETARPINRQMTLEKAEKYNSVKIVNYNHEYVYDFYLITNRKDITGDYLTNKADTEGKWYGYMDGPAKKITSDHEPFIYDHFRYYGYEETKWEIFYYKFHVSEKSKISFERWADSFGDFVYCEQMGCSYSDQDNYYAFFKINGDKRTRNKDEKGKEQGTKVELPTLLLPENAFHKLSEKKVSFLELNWLNYTLDTFPNFSKIFLCATSLDFRDEEEFNKNAEQKIGQIKTNIDKIVKMEADANELFNDPFYNFKPVLKNDEERKHILKNIGQKKEICEKKQSIYYKCKIHNTISKKQKQNAVLLHTIDYDTEKYMAFDLVQKQVAEIPFEDFTTGDSENESDGRIDYSYSTYDKFYYLCSYLVKLYQKDIVSAAQLMDILFDIDLLKYLFSKILKKGSDKSDAKKKESSDKSDAKKKESSEINVKELFRQDITPWIRDKNGLIDQSHKTEETWNNWMITLSNENKINYNTKIINLFSYLIKKDKNLIKKYDKFIIDDDCKEFIIGNTHTAILDIVNKKYDKNISGQILSVLDRIKKLKILNEIEYSNTTMNLRTTFELYQPVHDIAKNHVPKMLSIIKGIYNTEHRQYYRCKKLESDNTLENKEHNAVLPYAVDFDTVKYKGADKGISIMAFDLVQKRVVAVPFKDFTTGDSENESDGRIEYSYGPYDKFYYLCSYLVKLYQEDIVSAAQLMDILFDGIDAENLKDIITKTAKMVSDKSAKKIYKDSIVPWTDYAKKSQGNSQMEDDIAKNGISLFSENEIDYKQKIKNLFSYLLNKKLDIISKYKQIITDGICEEFIIGNTYDAILGIVYNKYDDNPPDQVMNILDRMEQLKILNEIEYINSNLKIHELLFYLKPDASESLDKRNIEIIYDYFRNFNCAGKKESNKEYKYIFKVQFEGFAYRKIQEIILALTDLIEVPESAQFYSDRIRNYISLEQKSQSELLHYRSKEGKEYLKASIQKYLAEKAPI